MASEPLGPITITAREVYDAVVRLTGRVDVLISQHSATQRDVLDHEARLRALEKARWPLPSISALVAVAALVVSIFVK